MPRASQQLLVSARKIPTQARARHKVDVILEAAAQILTREGEDGLNTNKIAERAGVSIGTLYQYFADKEAIILAVLERERLNGAKRVEAAIARIRPGPRKETVEQIIRILIESLAMPQRAPRAFAKTVMRLAAARNAPTELDQIAGLIVEMQATTSRPLDQTDVFVLTRAVIGAVRAAVLEGPSRLQEPGFERALVKLVLGYLA